MGLAESTNRRCSSSPWARRGSPVGAGSCRGVVALSSGACTGRASTRRSPPAGQPAAGWRWRQPQPLELPGDVSQRPQVGRGFASRLRAAVDGAFASSRGPVVLVGSDVPGLAASHVERTLELLEESPGRVVVGPSPDGGFYLLASAEPLDEVLAAVRWCCRETLASLRHALGRAGREVVLLAPLADLDRRSDLERWLAAGPVALSRSWRVLLTTLRRLLTALRRGHFQLPSPVPPRRAAVCPPPLRAPPIAA